MTLRLALILAATSLASASALAQEPPAASNDPAASQSAPPPEMKALVESCAARKFETNVEVTVDGKKRGSKVKLCGKEGQTDADWAKTLKDAVKKVEVNESMAQAVRDQIITALNAEIVRIESGSGVAIALPVATTRPAERTPEYAIYPPLPTAPIVATKQAPPPASAAATKALPSTPASAPKKPRLTIKCSAPGQSGGGSTCISLERDTLLTVHADENLAGGTSLRFLRRGDVRGEVALAQLRQGQSMRSRLPAQLCAGVARTKVEIQVLGANQVVDTLGPYELRC